MEQQMKINFRVILANTVAHPVAMMVHSIYAFITSTTVVITARFNLLAYEALIQYFIFALFVIILLQLVKPLLSNAIAFRLLVMPKPNDQQGDINRMILECILVIERKDYVVQNENKDGNNHVQIIKNDGDVNQAPQPYITLPFFFRAQTTSMAVMVSLRECSVKVRLSLTTLSRKSLMYSLTLSWVAKEILLTPPLLANLLIAPLVMTVLAYFLSLDCFLAADRFACFPALPLPAIF